MKFSSLAIATACFVGSSTVFTTTAVDTTIAQLLRGGTTTTTTSKAASTSFTLSAQASSCNSIKDESTCNSSHDSSTSEACVWCKCSAIPSECMSQSQSEVAPPGVFDCAQPTTTTATATATDDDEHNNKRFNFVSGQTHILRDDVVDPNLCDNTSPKSISGYMSVEGSKCDENGEDKHLFFWFFEKRRAANENHSNFEDQKVRDDEVPLIVWLTGGPGCSSTLALLTENGPCSVNSEGTGTVRNPYSWTETAHVLWLDQPAGVGFSYGEETDKNEDMVSEDAYYFLQAFYKAHPEYSANPLFVVGESYGGHYAPAIAHRVKKGNDDLNKMIMMVKEDGKDELIKINLNGMAIGNGLTNPEEQYKWYAEMGYNNSHNIKVFNEDTYNAMKAIIPKCTALIHKCNEGDNLVDDFACQTAFTVCNMGETSPYQMTGLNPYDIRKNCEKPPLCYDFSNVDTFLNLPSTREALHVSSKSAHKWSSCNFGINLKFHTDWMKDMSPFVAELLNGDIPVLIYAGDVDYICNYLGNKAWTHNLVWEHSDDFKKADEHEWNDKAGLARSANGFTFLQVYDAGHMVPTDQPKIALDMIRTFTSGGTF